MTQDVDLNCYNERYTIPRTNNPNAKKRGEFYVKIMNNYL